jgi:hypothetical protein
MTAKVAEEATTAVDKTTTAKVAEEAVVKTAADEAVMKNAN